jgi:probable F420-dependent oxidoreductase
MELGEYGVWVSYRHLGEGNAAEAAGLAEELGVGALWLGGSPRLPQVRPLLEGSSQLIVATGIVNVWAYDPTELAAEYTTLSEEFPGRLLLGVGIGHPEATSEYEKPLTTMRRFLDGLDAAPRPVSTDARCIAALGPKMLDLSARRSKGTHPSFTPVQHTRYARERLGPQALIAPELACVVATEAERDWVDQTARRYAAVYLGLRNYTNNLLEHGFTRADLDNGGSERLIDEIVPRGSAEEIVRTARAHREAGADHVCLQTIGVEGVPREQWTALAQALRA